MTDSKNKVYKLVGTSILAAIIIVLQIVTTYFPTKPFAITLALIPIIIGAAVFGEKAGAVLGGVFSIVVIAMCVFGVDVGGAMVWNASPILCILVCMLKGVAAGYVSGLVYRLLSKKNDIVGTVAAAIVAPIVNTGIFILGLTICFRPLLFAWAGESDVLYYVIFGLTGINFLVELGVNVVLSPIIVKILQALKVAK
ncbi:MAG: ECF transporter S component [Ruminococcus sp.]